jgi:hypothetical protein
MILSDQKAKQLIELLVKYYLPASAPSMEIRIKGEKMINQEQHQQISELINGLEEIAYLMCWEFEIDEGASILFNIEKFCEIWHDEPEENLIREIMDEAKTIKQMCEEEVKLTNIIADVEIIHDKGWIEVLVKIPQEWLDVY